MIPRFILLAGLGLCLLAGIARGDAPADATEQLLARLGAIPSLQGQFIQRQFGQDDTLQAESSGNFRLLRPGYFAWEILHPDSQLIIADPEYLWHYDRDLETVTRRPVAGGQQMSPLQVLGGDETVLREQFTIAVEGAGRFSLVPLGTDPGFKRLAVQLEGGSITAMEILDNLNQRVEIELQSRPGDELSSADFAFTPPVDADLFYYDQ